MAVSDGTHQDGGGGSAGPTLLQTDGSGVDWFNVTEIPHSGKSVALTGCDVRIVFNPFTNCMATWPGATRIVVGLVYPEPIRVIPWPNSGAGVIRTAQTETGSIRRIDSISDILEPKPWDGNESARYTPILTPSTLNWR